VSEHFEDAGDDDYVLLPKASAGCRKAVATSIAAVAIVAILAAAAMVWTVRQITPSSPQGAAVAKVVVPKGATFDQVAEDLEAKGIISSATVFSLYSRFEPVGPIRAGEYVKFRKNSSMAQAADVINAGPLPSESVVLTIIPGMWLSDALAAINKVFPEVSVAALKESLESGRIVSKYKPADQPNWEGFLLPETYEFKKGSTADEILTYLVKQFDATLDDLGYDKAEARTGHTAYELVTTASLIERETGDPLEERPKMARVIFNRLDQKVKLGIDASILYGLGRKGNAQPLTKSELDADGPYNNRIRYGLPPTPIALASEQSLKAAINPADGKWLYYVLINGSPREHFFTDSYDQFLEQKKVCQQKGLC
jgi:UPF0755 protein